MAGRMIIMLTALFVFVGVIGLVKYRQIRAAIQQDASYQPPPEAVTTIVAQQDQWQNSLAAIGTVTAVQRVVVSADLPGVVAEIAFDTGKQVREGDVLVRLDTSQEQAQLAAAEADQSAARVQEIRATIARKTIRAPISGVLGIPEVNRGQYLNDGDAIVPLQSLAPVYVSFTVPQQDMRTVRVGADVEVFIEGIPGVASNGKITALNSIVDETTHNVHVQATFTNNDARLLPGMFVDVRVLVGERNPVLTLPVSSISYAPYGDSVFIVEEVKAPTGETYRGVRQQFVKLGDVRGDQVQVVDGIKAGEEIVTSGVFKLRSGAAVTVQNDVQPANDPAPEPEDS